MQYSKLCHKITNAKWRQNFQCTPISGYSEEHIIKQWVTIFKQEVTTKLIFDDPLLTETFAVIRRGVTIFYKTKKHVEGVVPRDCQMVASLLFCQDLSAQGGASHGTKLMQQISTGEGKTMILCMVAI